MSETVHYEVFLRRGQDAPWVLDMATGDRDRALDVADELLMEAGVAAVRVTKEILNEETGEFKSVTIHNRGDKKEGAKRRLVERMEPLCVSPQDLYTAHARERIARLLDGWLTRQRVTPFELLHRADLLELLDASGTDLQHAVQKVAVPEAQARGTSTHEMLRAFQGLADRGIQRVTKDFQRGAFPDLAAESFADAATRLIGHPERAYLLGGGVANYIAPARDWGGKVNLLLDLADQAPESNPARAAAMSAIETPLSEILGSRAAMADVLGAAMDLGYSLAAMTRLAGAEEVEALLQFEPLLSRCIPDLPGPAARLAQWLTGPYFERSRSALAKRVLRELHGPRRLKPGDAEGEIDMLRALAMTLTAAAGRVLSGEDIQEAFTVRSKQLIAGDFVLALIGEGRPVTEEVEKLIRLTENVTGQANKRAAARYLETNLNAVRFEKEMRGGSESPSVRLATLAALQRAIGRANLVEADSKPIQTRLGEVGGMIEADSKLTALLAKAPLPVTNRLSLLIKMASGESAPLGPAADRARLEVNRLVRTPELRDELTRSPEKATEVREILAAAASLAA